MSYKNAIAAMAGSRGKSSGVSGLFQSKEEVHWYLNQTNADMDAFRNDVQRWTASKTSGEDIATVKGFMDFYSRWKKFYNEALKAWYAWGDHTQQIDAWRRRLIGWRQTFISRGMMPVTPNPEIPHRRDPMINSVLVAGLGALVGGYLTEKFVRRR